MTDYSQIGKLSKSKGSSFELKIATSLGQWWGAKFHRVPASGGLHWGSSMNVGGDVIAPPEAGFPFVVECKKREGWTLEQIMNNKGPHKTWWQQVCGDAEETKKVPMLIFAKNYSDIFVSLPHSELLEQYLRKNLEIQDILLSYVSYRDTLAKENAYRIITIKLTDLYRADVSFIQNELFHKGYQWRDYSVVIDGLAEHKKEVNIIENDMLNHIDQLINDAQL